MPRVALVGTVPVGILPVGTAPCTPSRQPPTATASAALLPLEGPTLVMDRDGCR